MATLAPAKPSTRAYRPPEGYYDQPFTWVYDASNLTDGQNALNQFIYIKAGYGDFICRRIVGLASVVDPTNGRYQIYDRYIRPIEAAPKYVTPPDTDDELLIREIDYPETTNIRFDLYDVLRDPTVTFTLTSELKVANSSWANWLSNLQGPGGTVNGTDILASILVTQFFPTGSGLTAAVACSLLAEAGAWEQQATIEGTGLGTYSGCAQGAMDGDTALVAYGESEAIAVGGAAFMFVRDQNGNWTIQQQLDPGDAGDNDGYGYAGALSGDWAAVSAPYQNSDAGAVYLYSRSGGSWPLAQKIVPPASADDYSGSVIFLVGEWLFVGSQLQTTATPVYVYRLIAGVWTLVQTIATDVVDDDQFGYAISSDGATLAIGAPQPLPGGTGSGPGYVYLYTLIGGQWAYQATVTGSDSVLGDLFGLAVSVSGPVLAVGAPQIPSNGPGHAYVFTGGGATWTQQQKITAADAATGNGLGTAISVLALGGASGFLLAMGGGNANTQEGYLYFYSAPGVIRSQIAFQGVRRQPGPPPQIAPSCPFEPRTFSYAQTAQLTTAGPATSPVSVLQTVNDYDFELDEIILTYSSPADSLPRVVSAVQLFDAVKNMTSNIPVLDVFMNGGPSSAYQNGAIVPPLLYPQQTQIRLDIYSMVEAPYLPITVSVEFRGRQRYPCVTC